MRKHLTLVLSVILFLFIGACAKPAPQQAAQQEIEELINKDRAAWIKFAHGLHDATMQSLKAIDAKDPEMLLDTGDAIDTACENCHKQYWYPDEDKPASASQKSGN